MLQLLFLLTIYNSRSEQADSDVKASVFYSKAAWFKIRLVHRTHDCAFHGIPQYFCGNIRIKPPLG